MSLADETIENGAVPTDLDAVFRVCFMLVAVLGLVFRGERAHLVISTAMLASFVAYILRLFLRLQA